jgi:XisH protein
MAKDIYHDHVKTALEKDGWVITAEPMPLFFGKRRVLVDLAAEKWIVAQKGLQKIAVEVKSFISMSVINDLHHAVGQVNFYELLLKKHDPNRVLYLAIPDDAYDELSSEPIIQEFLALYHIKIIVYDTLKKEIITWIN